MKSAATLEIIRTSLQRNIRMAYFTQLLDLVRDVVDPNCLRCFNALKVEVLLHFGSDADEL